MDRHSVRMELVDVLPAGDKLLLLAGYPHPTNDWGWDESRLPHLDDFDWNQPWNVTFWRDQVADDPERNGLRWEDVELEYDHNRVLVRTAGCWHKEVLPFNCLRLRNLPGVGLCALGEFGACLRQSGEWTELLSDDEVCITDAVADTRGELVAVNGGRGFGRMTLDDGIIEWEQYGPAVPDAHSLCRTPHGTYAAGRGLFRIDGRSLNQMGESDVQVRLSVEPDQDGAAVAAAADGRLWVLSAGNAEEALVKIPNGPLVTLTTARHMGRTYVSCGKQVVELADGASRLVPLISPTGMEDEQSTWPRQGAVSLRVAGSTLWAVCAHHLSFTGEGDRWDLLPFRDGPSGKATPSLVNME